MQCARCGKVLNLETRRCPRCLASLSNQQISPAEVAGQQLRELAEVERADATNRQSRMGAVTGAVVGAAGMVLTLHPLLVVLGLAVGAGVGWLVAWRRWGQYRAFALFTVLTMPVVVPLTLSPFAVLGALCAGMILGLAVQFNQGR